MTKLQRFSSFASGLITLAVAAFMLVFRQDSYWLIVVFLGFSFLIGGIGKLIYYFTMARFMVGGKSSLYWGVLQIDFAALSLSLTELPRVYILIYLAVLHGFSGLVEILRANETMSVGSSSYKLKLLHGLVNIGLALSCIVFIKKADTAVIIYSAGLIYTAVLRVISAFRRSLPVYIQ